MSESVSVDRETIARAALARLASAPSGSGKTALACHSIAQWLDSGRRDEVMVTALSSEIISAEGSIKIWFSSSLSIFIEYCQPTL